MARDPRTTLRYIQMDSIIDALEMEGPMDIDTLCSDQGISVPQFRNVRYSIAGRLAMEDRNVVIPRPVHSDGYLYKLGATYKTSGSDDAHPNLQAEVGDLLTRTATIYTDVERLASFAPSRSSIRKALRKLQKAIDATLDRAEDVALEADAPVSTWAQHVLDRLA